MMDQLKKFQITTSNFGQTKSFSQHQKPDKSQLFMPQQIETIKLNSLRSKRKELEEKLKLISNRISYRKKKQEEELRRYIRTEEKSRVVSETKNFKRINMMIKEELNQKKIFQERKKAKQVEDYRTTTNKKMHLIYQSVRDRKVMESQKVRQTKKAEEEFMQFIKQDALHQQKQKHEKIQKMKEQQISKRKCYWMEKKLSFQQNVLQEISLYENQIQNYYKKIEQLKKNQQHLKEKQQHAFEVLKCAEQNYQLLKQS